MRGRIENQLLIEKKIKEKITGCPKCVEDYYYHMTTAGMSHTTKNNYINHVISFLTHFAKTLQLSKVKDLTEFHIKNIKTSDIDRYMDTQRWKKVKNHIVETTPSHRATKLSALSNFFSFLYKKNYIAENLTHDKINRPKVSNDTSVVYLNEAEIQKVINNISKGAGTDCAINRQKDWKCRDMLLVLLPIYTGLRVTALSEINVEDVNLKEFYIVATDKGNKTKNHYFDEQIAQLLIDWLQKREEILEGEKCNALFISNRRTRIHPNTIRKLVRKYTYNIDKRITPHKLRSTCATNLYQKTNDIYLVSKVLGHTSTEPTRRYTEVGTDREKSVANIMGSMVKITN